MFRAAALSLLVLFQSAQTAPPTADAAKKALDQIQGTWQVVTMNGQDAPAGVDVHLTFTEDKYEQWANGTAEERGSVQGESRHQAGVDRPDDRRGIGCRKAAARCCTRSPGTR